MKQAKIIVSGHVQDVGFRMSVEENARECDLVGYVKNLTDGTVEIVCEGRVEDIKRLLSRIKVINSYAIVKNVRTEFGKATGKFEQFNVKYGDMATETFKILKLGTKHAMQTNSSISRIETRLDGVDKTLGSMDKTLGSMDKTLYKVADSQARMEETMEEVHHTLKDMSQEDVLAE